MKDSKAFRKIKPQKNNLLSTNFFIIPKQMQEKLEVTSLNQKIKDLENEIQNVSVRFGEMKNKMDQEIENERLLSKEREKQWKIQTEEYASKEKETIIQLENTSNKLNETESKVKSLENKVYELLKVNKKIKEASNNKIRVMENQLKQTAEYLNEVITNLRQEDNNNETNTSLYNENNCNSNDINEKNNKELQQDLTTNIHKEDSNQIQMEHNKSDNMNKNTNNDIEKQKVEVMKQPTNDIMNKNIGENKGETNAKYNEQFFEYKSFLPNSKLKRHSNEDSDNNDFQYKTKKTGNSWIKKEHKKPNKENKSIDLYLSKSKNSSDIDKSFSSTEDIPMKQCKIDEKYKRQLHSITEEDNSNKKTSISNKEMIIIDNSSKLSEGSLECNSNCKDLNMQNCNNKIFEVSKQKNYLLDDNLNDNENINDDNDVNKLKQLSNKHMYYNNKQFTFIELHKKKQGKLLTTISTNFNNNNSNPRNKKEREKMQAHKCEMCQQFYNILEETENSDIICNECSRHRANENIMTTPKGFYELSL